MYGWLALRADEDLPDRFLLPHAKSALKGWQSRYPGKTRVGYDLKLFDLFALRFAQKGLCDAATALLLSADGYFRPSEAIGLNGVDIISPNAFTKSRTWGVITGNFDRGVPKKNKSFDDTTLFNTPGGGDVGTLMSWVAKGKTGKDVALFPGLSLPKCEKAFNVVSKELDIVNLRITPHLARHSVASYDSLHKIRSKDEIRTRGHWMCPKSVDRLRSQVECCSRINVFLTAFGSSHRMPELSVLQF